MRTFHNFTFDDKQMYLQKNERDISFLQNAEQLSSCPRCRRLGDGVTDPSVMICTTDERRGQLPAEERSPEANCVGDDDCTDDLIDARHCCYDYDYDYDCDGCADCQTCLVIAQRVDVAGE